MTNIEYHDYLPLYRSLLTPNAKYDYKTHLLVQLSQLDLKNIISRFQLKQSPPSKSFKMKYKSLLTDVSRKASLLLMKMQSLHQQQTLKATQLLWNRCKAFSQLPTEIQIHVFTFVDDHDAYRKCLLVSKRFYQLSKPFLYQKVCFTSTYRFAQFITCLRVNSTLGTYVIEADLLQLKPGNYELEMALEEEDEQMENEDVYQNPAAILAGWRDWKFKNNPLYALHPGPVIPLTKSLSNNSINSLPHQKKTNFTKYFKKRRRSSGNIAYTPPQHQHLGPSTSHLAHNTAHPSINKFLMNYSNSKDVPIGYVLHLIKLCPNLESVNFGSLSLSTDYKIVQPMAHKYQSYDIMNNFHKDLVKIIESIAPMSVQSQISPFEDELRPSSRNSAFDMASLASSIFSMNTFSKPTRKYNSLLPPLPKSVVDFLYLSKGDGKVFLSDLNLKAINNSHLEIVNEADVFRCLSERSISLKSVNLSSMISINLKMVREFLMKMLMDDLQHKVVDGKEYLLFCGKYFQIGEPVAAEQDDTSVIKTRRSGLSVLDLTDSGMYKNLQWAQRIDANTRAGQKLIHRIINDELVSSFEEYVIRERIRRGRIGENYFS